MIYIGLDDTDSTESRGTGHLARLIAVSLQPDFSIVGVLRHQLLVDAAIPYTAKNSCAAILLDDVEVDIGSLFDRVRKMMLEEFVAGSDPGLAVAQGVPQAIMAFGRHAQQEVVSQREAQQLARQHEILLAGLGGTNDGLIGALAAVGLAATGNDGRYVMIGKSRELIGLVPVTEVLDAGIAAVITREGTTVSDGMVQADKLRPARRENQAVLFVESTGGDIWMPLKVD